MLRLLLICAMGLAGLGVARQARASITYDGAAEMGLINAAIVSKATDPKTRLRLINLRFAMRMNAPNALAHHNVTVEALALIGAYRIRH